jgi:hypothetical protein
MPGILDYNKILEHQGEYSTQEFRNSLLARNLPPPISDGIKDSQFANMAYGAGTIINVADTAGENIKTTYNTNKIEGRLLTESSESERQNDLLLNRFKPLNGYPNYEVIYTPYIDAISASLNLIGRGNEDVDRSEYPNGALPSRFNLLSKGKNVGVQFPYNVIELANAYDLNDETLLGLSSAQYLTTTIQNKIAQIEEELQPLTKTGSITPPINEDIVVPNYINKLRGVFSNDQLGISDDAIGWQEYNNSPKNNQNIDLANRLNMDLGAANPSLSTEQRMDNFLTRTSNEQIQLLLSSFENNLFRPKYSDSRLVGTSEEGTNSRYYIGSPASTNRGAIIAQPFPSSDFNDSSGDESEGQKETTVDETFSWEKETTNNFNEKTLLFKTQNLVTQQSENVFIDQTDRFFKDKQKGRLISRGNAISKSGLIDADFDGNYCRVWTVVNNYSYANAIRKSGLFTDDEPGGAVGFSATKEKAAFSVLQDNGIPKYHPLKEDGSTTFKKFMLSIENLAWTDNLPDLPLSEIGPGDMLTGNKGRIMWFPPYDLAFDENSSANWNDNQFIGRGEPLYTYNNATRTGQLRFKVLVDHPRVVNGYRGKRTNAIERFIAGCDSPQEFLNLLDRDTNIDTNTKKEIEKKLNSQEPEKVNNSKKVSKKFVVCFEYELKTRDCGEDQPPYPSLFEINDLGDTEGLVPSVLSLLEEIDVEEGNILITCVGFAGKIEGSSLGAQPEELSSSKAKSLSRKRAKQVYDEIVSYMDPKLKRNTKKKIIAKGNTLSTNKASISNQRVEVTIEYDQVNSEDTKKTPEVKNEGLGNLIYYPEFAQQVDNMVINETSYFDYIDEFYPNYFATISEKIKYFHPGFHSTTPEGLNTRLTFLNQCLRQGPSISPKNVQFKPQNLNFGRPPICILRIGDFIHTKVCITSLNITYEAGSGIQWDLNPSGIGVQPMMANITMSINILGGQSLQGPIDRLQNALSFNYYANTEMYDVRSDSLELTAEGGKIVPGIKLGEEKGKKEGGVDLDRLTESLKTEGFPEQKAAEKGGGATQSFETGYNIMVETSGTNMIVKSLTPDGSLTPLLSSEVVALDGTNKGYEMGQNLLVMEVDYKYSGETTYKTLKSIGNDDKGTTEIGDDKSKNKIEKDASTIYLISDGETVEDVFRNGIRGYAKNAKNNKTDIKDAQKEVDKYKSLVDNYEADITAGNYTKNTLTNLRKAEKDLEKSIKKLKKLKSKSLLMFRVTGYYSEVKSSSIITVEFTYEDGEFSKN